MKIHSFALTLSALQPWLNVHHLSAKPASRPQQSNSREGTCRTTHGAQASRHPRNAALWFHDDLHLIRSNTNHFKIQKKGAKQRTTRIFIHLALCRALSISLSRDKPLSKPKGKPPRCPKTLSSQPERSRPTKTTDTNLDLSYHPHPRDSNRNKQNHRVSLHRAMSALSGQKQNHTAG